MSQTQDITKLSITELKALAFDQIAQLEMCQTNLRTLNAEIQKKSQELIQELPKESNA